MSTYKKETKNPVTGEWENATWYDDLLGSRHYGVVFPSYEENMPQDSSRSWKEWAEQIAVDPWKIRLETRDRTPQPEGKEGTA